MDSAPARARKSFGPFNERAWVLRPTAFKEILDARGTIKACALALGIPVSTLRNWFDNQPERQSHPNWIPREIADKLDEYLRRLGRTAPAGLRGEPLEDAGARLVALHDEGLKNHYPELVRIEFRRDNRSPQAEGDAIAIGYHINVRTDWLYQGRNRRIGIRELAIRVIAAAGHVGELRRPAKSAKIPGVGLKIDGVRSELRADFAVEDPQAHLDLNGLDDAILLAIYERGRAGDGLTIELFVDLDHGFACVRAPNDPPAAPRTPRKFREKVIEHLAKRAVLGDLALAPHVTLSSQALKIAPEPEDSP